MGFKSPPPYGQPDRKISVFFFDDFPKLPVKILFPNNSHPSNHLSTHFTIGSSSCCSILVEFKWYKIALETKTFCCSLAMICGECFFNDTNWTPDGECLARLVVPTLGVTD